ncbi:hypothetical protein EV122DRAFT_284491 [Schizophyllum commune]
MGKLDPRTGAEADPWLAIPNAEWWKGRTWDGREGWFPCKWVEIIERKEKKVEDVTFVVQMLFLLCPAAGSRTTQSFFRVYPCHALLFATFGLTSLILNSPPNGRLGFTTSSQSSTLSTYA